MTTTVEAERVLLAVQGKHVGCDKYVGYIFGYRNGNHQNWFKEETCTYCNKKGHTEAVCFTKRDDDKLTKMAQKGSAVMAEQIAAINSQSMDIILK